ncbi:hypothetical protein FF38_10337 [Lucilia cuprina]|uniref:Uncharacterized protein n=1 Tax=Lucilia cuprina TaxID=7375 RepID=A0A0L0CJL2_LUCCU|nr:hypothetical protein FF38_10337 [Lucilia cuprina]
MVEPGTRSEGFNNMVLPQVMATGNIHKGIIAGKLKGAIPAVTPKGKTKEYVSISRATLATVSPICKEGMLQQCSTTSKNLRKPRKTSPSASAKVLPCSRVIFLANSPILALIKACNLNITCWRDKTEVLLQDLKAFLLDSKAVCISSCVHLGTRVTTLLVAGSCKSIHSLVLDSTNLPSTNILVVGAAEELFIVGGWPVSSSCSSSITFLGYIEDYCLDYREVYCQDNRKDYNMDYRVVYSLDYREVYNLDYKDVYSLDNREDYCLDYREVYCLEKFLWRVSYKDNLIVHSGGLITV